MCGIFGIVFKEHQEGLGKILYEAGKRLTYRGYDSVGCATIKRNGTIDLRKDAGKIQEVCRKYNFEAMSGIRGILQLRWATFGAPSQKNAQPHLDCSETIVGAHNGNIVNTLALREEYINNGHNVRGQNDGEIVVHTVEKHLLGEEGKRDWVKAIVNANKDMKGDYAYVITDNRKNEMYCAKKGSSLYLGVGEDFICCSSDLPSILPLTRRIVFLNDNEFVRFDHSIYQVFNMLTGEAIQRESEVVDLSPETATKGEYPFFMLKEINEQPQAVREMLHVLYASEFVEAFLSHFDTAKRIFFIGAGSSYNACVSGAYYFNKIAKVPVIPVIAGQFMEMYGNTIDDDTLLVCVSQSGETKDIINIVNYAREIKKGRILGILNVLGSTLMNRSDTYLPLACNLEISVPATKTFINQVTMLYFLALRMAERRGVLSKEKIKREDEMLRRLPELLKETIQKTEGACKNLAQQLLHVKDIYSLGFGVCHGTALEGALKIKEVTYSHCEGMYSAEFKHGPLSIVEKDYPVIYNAVPENTKMIISHINEVSCREGKIIVIGEDNEALKREADIFIEVPKSNEILGSILHVIPLQLLAYYWAVGKGINPDEPRNLSKTLTVD